MEIYDLNSLRKDPNQDDLYNFFVLTYKKNIGPRLGIIEVETTDEMRIDSVCNKIYDSVEYCDLLLNINDIDNPLNVKAGDLMVFPPEGVISDYRVKDSNTLEVRAALLNSKKSTRKDPNRRRFVEESTPLSPNLLPTPSPPVRIENNQLVIGG